jgi:hypothetical protein
MSEKTLWDNGVGSADSAPSREKIMICRIYDVPSATIAQYEEVSGQVSMERPQGAHVHIAGKNDRGLQVIEVWDSQEDIDRFMDAGLGKAMQAAHLPQPTITEFEVHTLDWVD